MLQNIVNFIKAGKVSEVDAEKGAAKVVFKENNNMVSSFMFVIHPFAGDNASFRMPNINDTVVCLMPAAGGPGFIIGSIYGENKPKVTDENKYNVIYDDNTMLEYDKKEHKLMVDIKGDAEVVIDKVLKITITENKELQAKNIKITADSEVSIECKTANIKANSEANIESAKVNIKGSNVDVGNGASMGIIHEGILTWLSTHTHTDSLSKPTTPPTTPPVKPACVSNTCKVSS